ncbi:amine dehydrogenase large subunit [Rhodovulum euryhalinum]|uniref:Methylamine dehydrogenase heavy chain n=1 Tax=Rhodovulum euryhalinum TaxID=35805 RepID=A0A4R2KBX4_9RHOB|nr:amine dehydrogenase large subunit [Rhodovulum euryhalinum]TCO69567.1 methylamine dehydrogenase heavy chain [Rhodovulum euryhalinum]
MTGPSLKAPVVLAAAMAVPLTLAGGPAPAQDFVPETLSVKPTIDPGPNVFVNQQQWIGAGSIAIFDQATLKLKALLPTGAMGQMLVSADGKTAWAQSSFLKRTTYGPNEMVLTRFDVETAAIGPEVILPPKAAMALGYTPLLRHSADGRFVLVQNATPASSVTVVDVTAQTVVQEIPTPGCWGIYPAAEGARFSTICGDGTFASYTLSADGTGAEKATSAAVFDPETDPIFIEDERVGDALLFLTYSGKLIRLSDTGAAVEKLSETDLVAGIEGGWAPGGYELIAANAAKNVLFVGMHPESFDGSHKKGMEEIWAIDLATGTVAARSKVEHLSSITVTPAAAPVLFGTTEEGKLIRYDIDAGMALTKSAETGLAGFAMSLWVTE